MRLSVSIPACLQRRVGNCLCAAIALAALAHIHAQDPKRDSAAGPDGASAVEIVGKVVPRPGTASRLVFQTDSGDSFQLVSNRMALALFVDTNLHRRLLRLKGRVLPGEPARFEVMGNLRGVRDGQLVELFYYCDICAIKGSDPGPCMCCREPVRLVEAPPGSDIH